MAEHERVVDPTSVGLPPTPFFYTTDQVAYMLSMSEPEFISQFVYYNGRVTGRQSPRKLKTVNIQPDENGLPMWRISEGELIRWLKLLGVKIYSRGRIV